MKPRARDPRREAELAVIGSLLNPPTREASIDAVKRLGLSAEHFASRDTASAFAQILIDAKTEWGIMDTSAESIGNQVTAAKMLAEIGKEKKAVERVLDNARQEALFKTVSGVLDRVTAFPNALAAGRALQDALRRFDISAKRKSKGHGRTLDSFSFPCPDEEDDDCLFQNRWLRRGMCGMIVAGSGVGKSVVSLQLAYHWAVGKPCLGIAPVHKTAETCQAGRSLPDGGMKIGIFQTEDDEFDIQKFRKGITNGLIADGWTKDEIALAEKRVKVYGLDEIDGMDLFSFMSSVQDEERFDLAFINPLFGFYEGDIKDNQAARNWLRGGLDPLIKRKGKEFGCFIIHHTSKPKTDDLREAGNVFAAYMGAGASEFTNYPRVTLSFVPWRSSRRGALPARNIFRLIGGKHIEQLEWKSRTGKRTDEKIVCYSYLVERYKDRHAIYWAEPTEDEWKAVREKNREEDEARKTERDAGESTVRPAVSVPVSSTESDFDIIDAVAEWIAGSGELKNARTVHSKICELAKVGYRSQREQVIYRNLVSDLERHKLAKLEDGRNIYLGTPELVKKLAEKNQAESLKI